ncbi:MAG: hypothetical protein ACI828_001784 [Flavobacteriales bacterium]|jgi:hypothetical protein
MIPVQYYKREKVKDIVFTVLREIKGFNFELELLPVYSDNKTEVVNTLEDRNNLIIIHYTGRTKD